MRHILVVAHKTLGGQHLLDELAARMQGCGCVVHLVVPVNHPFGTFTETSLHADAEAVLEEGLRRIRALDPTGSVDVTGEVGDANPVYAAEVVRNRGQQIDEILVSTLPRGVSHWILGNVPRRLERQFPEVEVVHLVAEAEPANA
jgi:nucleotide-binding universal stress UspA family protein